MKERIKELRTQLGMTQAQFAQNLGVDPATISKWEHSGKIPERKQKRIEELYGVNREWLATGEGDLFLRGKPKELPAEVNVEQTVQDRLKMIRRFFRLSQKDLADRLNMCSVSIAVWERDGVPASKQALVCETLGINLAWLRDGVGEMIANDTPLKYESAREFAIRHGCDDMTATIFEQFMNLPKIDKQAFERLLVKIISGRVANKAETSATVSNQQSPTISVRDVYSLKNSTLNQNNN